MLSETIQNKIEKEINEEIISSHTISHGLFTNSKITLKSGEKIFLKSQRKPNTFFKNHAYELTLLSRSIPTPNIICTGDNFIALDWIDSQNQAYSMVGQYLAKLHKNSSEYFGFYFDNLIGITEQNNAVDQKITSWFDFFWEYRLIIQINLAYENQLISDEEVSFLKSIKARVNQILDINIKPTLVHGDLWMGNIIFNSGKPIFIDPAPYYGHNEVDFSLLKMFGGFSNELFEVYKKEIEIKRDFEKRLNIYMLYHYLNHLNIFGLSYKDNIFYLLNEINKKNYMKKFY